MAGHLYLTWLGDTVCRVKLAGSSYLFVPGQQTDVIELERGGAGDRLDNFWPDKIISWAAIGLFAEIDPAIFGLEISLGGGLGGGGGGVIASLMLPDGETYSTDIVHPPYNLRALYNNTRGGGPGRG